LNATDISQLSVLTKSFEFGGFEDELHIYRDDVAKGYFLVKKALEIMLGDDVEVSLELIQWVYPEMYAF